MNSPHLVTALLVGVLVSAGSACLALTPAAIRVALRAGVVAQPGGRRKHAGLVPAWGGLAIYAAFAAAGAAGLVVGGHLGLIHDLTPTNALGIGLGATAAAFLGAVDDRFELRPRFKFAGQVIAASLLLPFGVQITGLSNPFAPDMLMLPDWLGALLTVVWVVTICNCINFMDGHDGLAAGVSGMAAATLGLMAAQRGQIGVAALGLALAGAAAGFLPSNFHPAKVFMGDLGSHLLGFTLAALAVMGAFKVVASVAVFVPLLVLAVPIFDTTFVVMRRVRNGQPIGQADNSHLHHRLLARGLSQRQVAGIIYLLTGLCCLVAFWAAAASG